MNSRRFTRHVADGATAAGRNLSALERGYRIALQTGGRRAADRFATLATVHLTADITDPEWSPPQNDQLIDEEAIAADAAKRTRPARHAILKAVMAPVLTDVGIAYDLTNPLVAGLLATLGVRAQDMGDAIRADVARAVLDSYQQGLSVPDTAAAIAAAVEGISAARATMLARTDLIGMANAGSIAAARLVNGAADPGEPQIGYKRWLATEDERTRETHAEADGQVVPIDEPFQVGSEQADFPGDPSLSDQEACNCRCTLTYLDAAEAAGETGGEDLPLAASGEAPTDAVASLVNMTTSPQDTTALPDEIETLVRDRLSAAAVTVTVDGDATAETVEPEALPVRWRAILCIEGQETQDNATLSRIIREGTTTWRDLPLPLGVIYQTPHSDSVEAELCGLIDLIERDESDFRIIWGEGSFNPDDSGRKAAEHVANLSNRGISIDPYVPEIAVTEVSPETDTAPAKMLVTMINPIICAATICPVQALDGAQITLLSSGGEAGVIPMRIETCFVLTVKEPAVPAELVADGWSEPLAALTASVERLVETSAPAQNEGLISDLGALNDRVAAFEKSTREELESVAASAARIAAKVERLVDPSEQLRRIERDLTSLAASRGRTVQFERDEDGKLAGLREG